jgi:flagellar basal-body rod protein FlgF
MDRFVFIASNGASQLLEQQAIAAHNLANAGTAGYKAETSAFRVAPVSGPGQPTRAYSLDTSTGADLAPGVLQPTGRDLDVAIEGEGFFAVQGRDGSEAYTRGGSFSITSDGELTTREGLTVLGDGGPITVPSDSQVSIGRDGTITATTPGQTGSPTVVGKLKLVNAAKGDVVKGGDGLFRMRGGGTAEPDDNVRVAAGVLESSNVNPIGAMVDMINLQRQFEMQMKLLSDAENNDQRASQILSING